MTVPKEGLASAMLAFQAEAPDPVKDATNPAFKSKYVSLTNLIQTVRPVLNKHGLVLIQSPTTLIGAEFAGTPALQTKILHASSGESVESVMPLLLSKQDAQGLGSALTYARRYAITAMLCIAVDEDDDGNAASARQPAPAPDARQTSAPPLPAPAQQHSVKAGELMSEAQGKKIAAMVGSLAKARGVEKQLVVGALEADHGPLAELTKTTVSEVIDKLERWSKNAGVAA